MHEPPRTRLRPILTGSEPAGGPARALWTVTRLIGGVGRDRPLPPALQVLATVVTTLQGLVGPQTPQNDACGGGVRMTRSGHHTPQGTRESVHLAHTLF